MKKVWQHFCYTMVHDAATVVGPSLGAEVFRMQNMMKWNGFLLTTSVGLPWTMKCDEEFATNS